VTVECGARREVWSGYGLVIDLLCGTDIRLDLTPLGRQDEDVELRHHDKYPEDSDDQQSK
jgi:predicted dithiol-disulfide oxidoreductase (DUF899 family)